MRLGELRRSLRGWPPELLQRERQESLATDLRSIPTAKSSARDRQVLRIYVSYFHQTVRLIGRPEEVSVQKTLEAVRKQLKLMIERGLDRDIDMSCHVSQGTRAGERLPDEGVRAGKRRTERRCRGFACIRALQQSAFLRRSGRTVLQRP